jgi:hypothetical protein
VRGKELTEPAINRLRGPCSSLPYSNGKAPIISGTLHAISKTNAISGGNKPGDILHAACPAAVGSLKLRYQCQLPAFTVYPDAFLGGCSNLRPPMASTYSPSVLLQKYPRIEINLFGSVQSTWQAIGVQSKGVTEAILKLSCPT